MLEINESTYKNKKVINIGLVSELTGLSVRQIRYYEERKLIFPERKNGNRKYSFADVESLIEIANKMEDGVQTYEIRQDMLKKEKEQNKKELRDTMLRGQINAQFGFRK